MCQKLNYMQNNPCIGKWQLALNAIEYIYSSARFYLTGVQGIYPVSNFMEMEENLYNGNIRAMVVNIPQLGNAGVYGYRYDQLNRIKGMNSFNGFANATNTLTAAAVLDYRERVTYDPSGNIRTYIRNGNAARFSMDSMTYTYKANKNQLDRVVDSATDASILQYPNYNDIKQGQIAGNYQYDAIGNLISDASEGITNINWTVYGKIDSITKSATNTTIKYGYDASGNRISKVVKVGSITTNTIYVRDASGNIMAVYTKDAAVNSGSLTQTEISMYGSSRLGVWNPNRNVATLAAIDYAAYSSTFIRGCKGFELTNHLGNVLVTVSDKRVGINDGTYNGAGVKQNATLDNFSDYFVAEVVTANDYYPGGMQMPGRKFTQANSSYRYGFNGKENDNEVKGEGNQQDYGMRIYDPRLVKFLSVDPLTKTFPFYTPYQFSGNSPIKFIDLDGGEPTAPKEDLINIRLVNSVDKGNLIKGTYDPNDRLHRISVEKLYDPIKKQAFFVHQQGEANYYWNSSQNNLRIERKADGTSVSNGKWERYDTHEQTQQKIAAQVPNIILGFLGGGAAVAVAAPVIIPYASAAAATYGTGVLAASGGVRAVGAVANAGFQYLQNAPEHGWGMDNIGNMNVTSIGLTALNPAAIFTNAVGSNFGKITFNTGTSQVVGGNNFNLKSATTGAAIDFFGGKLGEGLGGLAGKYGGFKPLEKAVVENVLGGAVTTPANTIAGQATKNEKP